MPFPSDPDEQRATAAERQQRHRDRKKDGGACFAGELTGEQMRALVREGWTSAEEARNFRALGGVLFDMLDCWRRGKLDPPADPDS